MTDLATYKRGFRKGFTLVEILIVVTILAIVAMVAVPRMMNASTDAREAALATDLQMLRRQIDLYKHQHNGRGPHVNQLGQSNTANMTARLLGKTDVNGQITATGEFGPYLTEWPTNPFADSAVAGSIQFGKKTTPARNDTTGWYFSTQSGMIFPNTSEGALEYDNVSN